MFRIMNLNWAWQLADINIYCMITSTINYSFRLNFTAVELEETRDFKSECNLCENL
jgi:hypothetical protein